jgi:hypothetical protein
MSRRRVSDNLDLVTQVARDLTAIERLAGDLETQAVHHAGSKLMPGGEAMVQLGPTASMDEWAEQLAALELRHETGPYACPKPSHRDCKIAPHVADEDDTWPAFQTLRFWSEQWREQEGYPLEGRRPTIATEAGLIRHMLHWAWEHEPDFATMASDVADARRRLEDVLSDGVRSRRGVPCLSCGATLRRPFRAPRPCSCSGDPCPHDRGGLADEWRCRQCNRRYRDDDYRKALAHYYHVHAEWLPLEQASRRTGVEPGAIKMRASRGHVAKRADAMTGRTVYRVADIDCVA